MREILLNTVRLVLRVSRFCVSALSLFWKIEMPAGSSHHNTTTNKANMECFKITERQREREKERENRIDVYIKSVWKKIGPCYWSWTSSREWIIWDHKQGIRPPFLNFLYICCSNCLCKYIFYMFEETKLRDDLILMVFLLSARAARVRVRVCVCVCVCCIRYFSSLLFCAWYRDIVLWPFI